MRCFELKLESAFNRVRVFIEHRPRGFIFCFAKKGIAEFYNILTGIVYDKLLFLRVDKVVF